MNDEGGSSAWGVAEEDGAAMHLDGLLYQGEAQAGAARLGGVIGIKNAMGHRGRDPGTMVPNLDSYTPAIFGRADYLQLALFIARLCCIAQDVAEGPSQSTSYSLILILFKTSIPSICGRL